MAKRAHDFDAPRAGPKRRLELVESPPWASWRGTNEATRAVRFIERYCHVPTGARAGELLELAGFQRRIVRDLYEELAAFVSLPVANGKTTLLGAIGLERICRGDSFAEVDVVATKLGQAGEVVTAAYRIAQASPEIAPRVAMYEDAQELRYLPTASRLRAQPAKLKSLEGLQFSLALVDEIGFAQDEHVESLLARLGKRPDAHVLGIGTPGFEPNVLWRLRRDSLEESLPPHVRYREWAAPEGVDVHDRRAWRIANPALAAGFLRTEALETQAELMPEARFRTYVLGQWVDQSAPWLPPGTWEACPFAEPPADSTEVVLAVEGTYARTVAIVGAGLDGTVFFAWAAERATDDELRVVIEQALEQWRVVELVHSRRIRQRLFRELENEGVPVRPWDSALDVEAGSANEFYRALVEGRIAHDHDDLLAAHIRNLRVRLLGDGSLRLVRPETGEHCDAGIAARNAWHRAGELADSIPLEPPRIY